MARFELGSEFDQGGTTGGTSPEALFQLGLKFASGRDVEMDLVSAHKWFNLAAVRGNEAAREYRMEISREMSRGEIAEAQRQAREWLRRG